MDHIVVDVEIKKTIEETPGGWDSTHELGVSVAVVFEFRTDRFRIYGPDDVPALRERLLKAERISGFNTVNFDYPVVFGHSKSGWLSEVDRDDGVFELRKQMLATHNDILRRIWESQSLDPDNFSPRTHEGFKLDVVAQETLGIGKIGNGADAPKWFQAGLFHKLIEYCIDDVTIERDLATFVDRYGYVIGRGGRRLYLK